MKKLILLIALVLILGAVNAAKINAPATIPANTNWSFSVELNSTDSFSKTEIFFDGLLVVTAFNNKPPIVHEDFVLKSFTFDSDQSSNSGLTIYASYFGIPEGLHEIKAVSYKTDSTIEETKESINAIQPLPEEFKGEVNNSLKNMSAKIDEASSSLKSLKEETEKTIGEKSDELNKTINSLEETKKELKNLSESLDSKNSSMEERISLMEKSGKKEEGSGFLAGMASTIGNFWLGGLILLAVVALSIALFFLAKSNKNTSKNSGEKLIELMESEDKKKAKKLSEIREMEEREKSGQATL